jgi:teichuronic acid biosynthesis glycosyltransferase TuaC
MKAPIRILTVIPGTENGATMIFAKRQVRSLESMVESVKVFYLESRTSIRKLQDEKGKFGNLIREYQPGIVHCHYGTITSFFTVLSTRLPVIITFHGSDLNRTPADGLLRDFFGRLLSNFSALRAAKIICVSEALKKKLWWMQSKVVVIPMGVDTDLFIPAIKAEARKMLGWKENDPVIIFNARDPKIKRLDIAMAVAEKVKLQFPSVRMEVLKGNVDPSRIPLLLNASDCLLLCSDKEGSPTIVKEAMACNLPVVSSHVGDVPKRLEGVSPSFVVSQDAGSLAHAVCEVLKENRRSNGRDKIMADRLSETEIAKEVVKVYRSILE